MADPLIAAFRRAQRWQKTERLAAGDAYR